ncbi:MAG TPA: hypothetical protein VIF62_37230, partial [Labilithrix sp.]
DFFHNLGGDTLGMMDALGTNYIDTGHYPEAITLYRDLIARDKGPRVCGYQARIAEATMAMKSSDKDAIRAELENQLRAASGNKEHACQSRTAALVAETAMAWHIEAVGTPGQRGTNDTRTMALAAQLYQRVVDTWTSKDLESFEFPRLVREDWPTLYKIRASMADLLYSEKDWKRCGPAFDAVFAMDPKNADAPRWAYAAGLCYQSEWEKTHQGDAAHSSVARNAPSLAPKPLTGEQKAMIGAFDRYVCNVKPTDAAGEEQRIEVAYARARTYFEAQHWAEAALAFRAIAMEHAGSEAGVWAAQLYLEAENVLVKNFSRGACVSEMTADMPKLLELHCSGDRAQKNAEACTGLRVVQVDLQRLEAERFVTAGEYERGGQAYWDLFRRACQDPVAAGQKPQAERCDEIAYDAAKAFQAARLLAKAITVRRALVAFDERLHLNSPWTKKATYETGAAYQAIAVYEQAADWYERYAKADPRADKADQALSDAVLLRLGLGQVDEALRDAKDFLTHYGASKPAQTAAIAFAIGAHHAEHGDWEKSRAALAPAMNVVDRAPPDVQIQARAVLGRAYANLRQSARAHAEYARARSLWADPAASEKKIRDAYPNEDDAARDRRVTRTITSVGEALFFFAEEKRIAEVEPLAFPDYKGPGDKASVKAHVETKVKDWYTRKMAAIQRVEPEYWKILELKPAPPPRWVIAAGSRTGLMWGDFVDDFRRSPIPRAWRGTELERIYVDTIDLKSAPFKDERAKPALKKCLSLATQYQYFDDYSRSCEVWLAKNYKQEYHVVDELRGAASLANGALAERMPPVLVSGASFHGR